MEPPRRGVRRIARGFNPESSTGNIDSAPEVAHAFLLPTSIDQSYDFAHPVGVEIGLGT